MRREHLVYVLVFGVSYAGFLGYFYRDRVSVAAVSDQPLLAPQGAVEPTSKVGVSSRTVVATSARSASPPNPKLQHSTKAAITRKEESTVVAEPLVIDYTSHQTMLSSLESAVVNDEYSENRVLAVERLRQLAAEGDANGQIREALRAASSDTDPLVASSASAAYTEVSVWAAARKKVN